MLQDDQTGGAALEEVLEAGDVAWTTQEACFFSSLLFLAQVSET